eukprot:jgi/Ulvmu1/6663/UM003_0301.1
MACFRDLDDDLLSDILSRATILDVPTLRSVCKHWQYLCDCNQVVEKAFLRTWGLDSVDPMFSQEELLSLRPSSFVTVHHLRRGETMQALAIRYGATDIDIRVLNNLLSERALTAHSSVYVPLLEHDAAALDGKHLRRDVTGALGRVLPVVCDDAVAAPEVDVLLRDAAPSSGMRALQVRLLAEEEAVPTGAAQYYLTEAGGDVRAAKAMHRDDMVWEDSAEGRRMLELYDCRRRAFADHGVLPQLFILFCRSVCLPCCLPLV